MGYFKEDKTFSGFVLGDDGKIKLISAGGRIYRIELGMRKLPSWYEIFLVDEEEESALK